jgi:hypothetical protein
MYGMVNLRRKATNEQSQHQRSAGILIFAFTCNAMQTKVRKTKCPEEFTTTYYGNQYPAEEVIRISNTSGGGRCANNIGVSEGVEDQQATQQAGRPGCG